MKTIFLAAAAMLALTISSSAYGAGATIHIGGGLNRNTAPANTQISPGIHGSVDFKLGESPIALGVFGEANFKEAAGKPILFGLNLYLKKGILGGGYTEGLEPKIYIGPNIGLASIDLSSRQTVFHMGGTIGVDFPLTREVGLFGMVKYAWAAEKNGVKTMSGFTAHAGIAFNIGE